MRPGTDSVARYRAAFAQRNLVQEIEALTARAWPPLTLLDLDGWQLRSSGGLGRRANSVWPRTEGTRLSLEERLRQAEAFYVQGGLDPAVQLSPSARPTGLEPVLRARGYRPTPEVEVGTRRVDLLARAAAPDGSRRGDAARRVGRLVERVALVDRSRWLPDWAAATAAGAQQASMAARILERARPPAAFAVLREDGDVAVARGVLDGGWLGIDLLAASAGLRTEAAGSALMAALGRWALQGGAELAYCEVERADPAAVLRAAAGFRKAYAYRYRMRPRALVTR